MKEEKGKLGLFACIAIIVGGCIGSAIFSLLGQTIYYAGPAAIISWIAAGLILAFYGMQVCELAVRYPQSGGIFAFPQKAIGGKGGEFLGGISAWGYIISNIIAIAFSAITIGNFMGNGFASLGGDSWKIALAITGIIFCIVLNLMKITDAGKLNNAFVAVLVAGMLIFAGFAFFGKRPDGTSSFNTSYFLNFFSTGGGVKGMFKAIPIASCAYGACVAISFMVSEVKNPNKTIPSSLFIGLILVIILYLIMAVATLGTCAYSLYTTPGLEFLWFAPQFGSIMMDGLIAYPWLAKLIAIIATVALMTTMLVLLALNARAIQAVADSGLLPKVFSKENSNGVPAIATIICGIPAVLLCLKPSWVEMIVNLGAILNVISMSITCIALIVSRKKTTLEEGQFKCPGGIVTPVATIVVLGACYLIGNVSSVVVLFTVIIYATFIAIFFASKKKRSL